MPHEKLVGSWMWAVFSGISDDFSLAAGQRLHKPARVSIKERVELVLRGSAAALGSCVNPAVSERRPSAQDATPAASLRVAFAGGYHPSHKAKVTFVRKYLLFEF